VGRPRKNQEIIGATAGLFKGLNWANYGGRRLFRLDPGSLTADEIIVEELPDVLA
jgi:hypothetical protein